MTTVTYSKYRAYSGNRPYSDVTLLGIGNNSDVNFQALVDTGADYLQLPQSAASIAGINLNFGQQKIVHGATGTSNLIFIKGIKVEVEGKRVKVHAYFDPTNSSSALLDRQCLLAAIDAGFNTSEWLWKY